MLKNNSRKVLLLLPFILILLIDIFYTIYNYNRFILPNSKTIMLSTIFIYSLFSIIVFITKSLNKANIILYIFFFVFLIINQIKIFYTQEPIYISDMYHLFNAEGLIDITNGTLIQVLEKNYITLIYQVIIFGSLVFIMIKVNSCIICKRNFLAIIIPCFILIFMFFPNKMINQLILSNVYDNEKVEDYNYSINDVGYYAIKGVISGMYGHFLENQVFKPDNYNENELEKILKEHNDIQTPTTEVKPNIILYVSESFWDIEQLSDIEFDQTITSNFRKIGQKKNAKTFNMISPTYGGLSANVEWELLVGANVSFYSKAYIPYLRIYKDQSYYERNSLIKELKENGYSTNVLAATSKNSYNHGKVYDFMKFDSIEYFNKIDEKYKKGYYVSDEYITTKLIENLKNNNSGGPTFNFVFTMQAHMPYMLNKYDEYDIKVKNSKLDKESNDVLLSYAQGIYDADQQLKRLYEFLLTYEEPTILVFLGDHLPYLSTEDGNNVVDKLNYFNTKNEKLNLYRKYNVQSLIVSNYHINHDSINYLGTDLLMPYVLEKANINLSPYYKYLNDTRNILPAFNRYITIAASGDLQYTHSISKDLLDVYNLRKNLQYKLFFM